MQVQESLAKANQVATETFSNMKTVRSFANEDGETEKYRLRLEDTYALNKKEAAAYAASTWANSVSWTLIYATEYLQFLFSLTCVNMWQWECLTAANKTFKHLLFVVFIARNCNWDKYTRWNLIINFKEDLLCFSVHAKT